MTSATVLMGHVGSLSHPAVVFEEHRVLMAGHRAAPYSRLDLGEPDEDCALLRFAWENVTREGHGVIKTGWDCRLNMEQVE